MWHLAESPRAFIALREGVNGISDRMLTEQLSQMVEDRLVVLERDEVGHRYRLTPLGLSLIPVLQMLQRFGEALIDQRDNAAPGPLVNAARSTWEPGAPGRAA